MGWNQQGVDAYVTRLINKKLRSSFVNVKPLLAILIGRDKAAMDKIGDPQFGVMVGGAKYGAGKRKTMLGSISHEFRYQKSQTDEAEALEYRAANTPTATGFAEDNVGTAATKWSRFINPVKIDEDDVENAQGDTAIANIIEEAVDMAMQRHLEKHQSSLWTGSLTSAQQNAKMWLGYLGLQHTISDGSTDSANYATYGTVDRTVAGQTALQGNVYTAANLVTDGYLADSQVKLRLIRQIKHVLGGMKHKHPKAGNLIITTSALWETLADEADGKAQIFRSSTSVPEMAVAGFELPVIKYDDAIITYDPDCPDGELYALTTECWSYEIQKGSNFQIQKWTKKHETEEGAPRYRWTNINTKARLTCTEPWLQAKVTGLTVDGS